MTAPTIITDRLEMRSFTDADLDAYTQAMTTAAVRSSLHLPDTFGRAECWNQMAAWVGQWQLRGTGQWALIERSTGVFVGRAGLHRPERHDWPGVEVGWALAPEHWGQGYATEAGQASLDYAFGTLSVPEVWSLILPENRRSSGVANRLGLSFVGLQTMSFFPDEPHGLWRITAEQWHARMPSQPSNEEHR